MNGFSNVSELRKDDQGRMGQTHVNRWTDDLLHRIEEGQIDPSFVVTHRVDLEDGPGMYKTFRDKEDGCEGRFAPLKKTDSNAQKPDD